MVLPLLVLLPAVFSTPTIPNPAFVANTAAAFLVAFSLLGVPASGAGLGIALAKVGLEAVRWTTLKLGTAGERGGAFLMGSGIVRAAGPGARGELISWLTGRAGRINDGVDPADRPPDGPDPATDDRRQRVARRARARVDA